MTDQPAVTPGQGTVPVPVPAEPAEAPEPAAPATGAGPAAASADPTPGETSGRQRAERFLADAEALDVPTSIAKTERRVLVVGALLVAGGLIAIVLGYWGASGTAKIYEEIPYLISGGIFGIALVVLGAFLVARYSMARLLRFWLARLSAEHQLQTDRLIAAIERLEARDDA